MATSKFTFDRKALGALQPTEARASYRDTDTRGLILDVMPTGVKTFRIYRKVDGRPERITLGRFNSAFPDSRDFARDADLLKALISQPELNVRMARRLGDAVNMSLDSGLNPAETKRKARGELTLGEMLERYIEDYAEPRGRRSITESRELFKRYLGELDDLPRKKHGKQKTKPAYAVNWQNRKLSSIRADEVRKLHIAIARDLTGVTANRVIELVTRLFNKAIEWEEFKGTSPTSGIEQYAEPKRARFIQRGEMPAFWAALAEEPNEGFRDFVTISILTGARSGNVRGMRWADINFDSAEWIIPGDVSKNLSPMTVMLVTEAIAILQERKLNVPGEWVFPSSNAEQGFITPPKKRWAALLKRAGLDNLRLHDLRRSLGSWQARTGASLLIIGKSLGHKSSQATEIYARLDTDPVLESVQRATTAMLAAGRAETPVTPISNGKRKAA